VLLEPVFDSKAFGLLNNCFEIFLGLARHHLLLSFLIKIRSVLILTLVNTASFVVSFGLECAFIDFLAVDFCNQSLVDVLLLLNVVVIFFFE
jgi:hypothetical protein